MPGSTNKGAYDMAQAWFRNSGAPTAFYMALVTSAVAPGPDTNVLSDLTQINLGNGYSSGGLAVARNSTDFDVLTEDDTNDYAYVQIKDLAYTASGGSLPNGGSGARYAVLTDDNATPANREVYHHFDLVSDRSVSDTQTLTLQNCEIRIRTV